MREYVSRVCNAVLECEQLTILGPAIPDLLAAQLRAAVIVNRYDYCLCQKSRFSAILIHVWRELWEAYVHQWTGDWLMNTVGHALKLNLNCHAMEWKIT